MNFENLLSWFPPIFFIIACVLLVRWTQRKATNHQTKAIALFREQADLTKALIEEIKGLRADLKNQAP